MLKNRKRFTCISLLLLCAFVFSWASVLEAASYKDSATLWPEAWQAIGELSAGDIVKGYQDGYFRPDSNVTKLETVALLIRMIGREEQAKSLDKATVDYKVPGNLFWGRGYLIVAAEQGMLVKEHLNQLMPSEPATRAEVAVLVYHALKLSPDGGSLNFSDAEEIPAAYRDFVASVVQKKIMVGLPGNAFKPNDNITRAQITVLLSRLIDDGWANPYPKRWMKGTLSAYDKSTRTITLQLGGYTVIDKILAEDCQVFRGGKVTNIGTALPGEELKLVLNSSGRVAFIKLSPESRPNSADDQNSYEGRLESYWLSNGEYFVRLVDLDGRTVTYKLDPAARIYQDGARTDSSALEEGVYVTLQVQAGAVSEIRIMETETVRGKVISVTSSRLKVEKSNGDQISLSLPKDVVVEKDGSKKSIDDLTKGNRVEVTVYDDRALKVEILSGSNEGDVSGEIRDIDSTGTLHITVRDDDGDSQEYEVDEDVRVYRDGDRIDFEDLDEGEYVSLDIDSSDVVTRIEVIEENDSTVSGTVTDLSTGLRPRIRIEEDGSVTSYYIDADARYYRDSDRIDLSEIPIGCEVELTLENGKAARVEITDDEDITVEGKITGVSTSRKRVTIRQESGNEFSYTLGSSYRLRDENGDTLALGDLENGRTVKIQLRGGDIYRLEVMDK